jgi:predicted  nucleic acid-binding Zn-ribbon protein
VDSQLATLIDLQGYDARISALEAEATRLPKQIEAIQASLAEARKTLEGLKSRIDAGRKDLRAKEKDLEVIAAKRAKQEARLYEVKTNKEYSAALLEIEESKQEKAKTEEDILGLMELQERLNGEIREAEVRFKTREEQGKQDEAVVRKKLAAVEQELSGVRGERTTRARDLPAALLGDYERIAKARSGIAVASVSVTAICGGCRVSIRPQAILELRAGTTVLMRCESCGRFLYWQEAPSPV